MDLENPGLTYSSLQGLENGMEFPPFSDYQDVFSSSLPTSMFSTFSVPTWVPLPAVLLRMAKVVYPYWKERRLERAGYQIIPAVNVGVFVTEMTVDS